MTFTERHGLVQYSKSRNGKYAQSGPCELCEAGAGCVGALVFDHCHLHGWIRGVICQGWNMSLAGPFGAETRLRAGTVSFRCKHAHRVQRSADNCMVYLRRVSGPWLRAHGHLRHCPDCSIPELVIGYPEFLRTNERAPGQ